MPCRPLLARRQTTVVLVCSLLIPWTASQAARGADPLPAHVEGDDPVALDTTEQLPNTAPLTWAQHEGDLADRLMNGAHAFVQRKIDEARVGRANRWRYDFSKASAYAEAVAPNRQRLKQMLGVEDADRLTPVRFERVAAGQDPALVAETEDFQVHAVRWSALPGVDSEGLMLTPRQPSGEYGLFIPDADQTPEQLIGLGGGPVDMPARIQSAAKRGRTILVPVLINRHLYLGPEGNDPRLKQSDQTHREWIYRQAFHMGRHIIGYEIQKILAAVDWIRQSEPAASIYLEGTGEGALLAFYAAACDPRIAEVIVHGYFGSRERVWSEPIYHNVFGLLSEFGDAEIASLIHPRRLIIAPVARGPMFDNKGTRPPFDRGRAEAEIERLPVQVQGSIEWLDESAAAALVDPAPLQDQRHDAAVAERHARVFGQLEDYTQALVRGADAVRDEFYLYRADPQLRPGSWSTERLHRTLDPQRFIDASRALRRRFEEEAIGRFDEPMLPPNARTRKVAETDQWTAYDVVLDVYPELFSWGVLVLPKGIGPGERRPVVVCQHGRGGLPRDTIDGHESAYNDFAARLAECGLITFAPHNLYRGEDRYRWLDRKANSIGCTLFSFIVASHRQLLNWLPTLPQVDPERIAFYGLSYGGETAVRIPSILEGYCLSICSGDFNQWTRKVAATDFPNGFMRSIEWEMPYWKLGETFDYAEMAYLIFPRPFFVERGHHDLVSTDAWVAHEYAKVRWLYAQYGLSDRTSIAFFQGGHSIHGEASFEFLYRHLNWPAGQTPPAARDAP